MGSARSSRASNAAGVHVLDRLDFLFRIRLGRRQQIAGLVLIGVLAISLALTLTVGTARLKRVLFFPADGLGRLVAEERFLPNHRGLERNIRELVDGEILGPTRHDAGLLMPREVTVRTLFVRSRVLYLDLSEELVLPGPDVLLQGAGALKVMEKAILFNFPRVRQVVFTVGGQAPRFAEEKKNR
jgi:hypothetical protein